MRDARTTGRNGPFASDEGMEQLVAGAGYAGIRTVAWELTVRFASAQQHYDWSMTTGQRAFWMQVPEAERPVVREQVDALLTEHADDDGAITLNQGVRLTLATRP
jgi:hypothetical protein